MRVGKQIPLASSLSLRVSLYAMASSLSVRVQPPLFSVLKSPHHNTFLPRKLQISSHSSSNSSPQPISKTTTTSFTWDDVFKIAGSDSDPSDLNGFLHKIAICNRGSEKHHEFIPFVVEEQIVGYVHSGFADYLRRFQDVFVFTSKISRNHHPDNLLTLHPMLRTVEERTNAVADVIKCLGELIPGIRNELFPVSSSFGAPVYFSLERAAAPYFGIKPHGVSCAKNIVKECEEEAGIPSSISNQAIPTGAVSYMDIDGYRYKRDVLFCYDLKLPENFIPKNQDGEVESFKLVLVEDVANVIRKTQLFKTNCNLVIIDFLFRHGYIKPGSCGYLKLLQSLRSGDCS